MSTSTRKTCGRILLNVFCMALLCGQCAFLDLFLIHHGEGDGFARGYVWVIVDAFIVVFWLMSLVFPQLGVKPSTQLPQQPRGSILKELLYAYMSWLVFAPLLVAKIVRLYNTVEEPSEQHWAFTPQMLRIALSMTGILFVILTHCHDEDVDKVKYKLRMRMVGQTVGFTILDASDLLSMLHVKGASGDYPTILRNVLLVFGNIWFILPLLSLLALRIMAAEKDETICSKAGKKDLEKNSEQKTESPQSPVKIKIVKSTPTTPNMKPTRSLDYPQFERKVIQLRNDMFVSDINKTREQRCKSYDDLCSESAPPKPIAHTQLSRSLNFGYWNYNQNCKVEALTLEKPTRQGKDRKEKTNSMIETKGDNNVNHSNEKKKSNHVVLEAMRHSRNLLFNVILFRNAALISVMDIPFLCIRLHLWIHHGVHASVFLTKNILMILGLILQILYEPPTLIKEEGAKGKAVKVGIMTGIGFP